jgi:plasmid stability protein
MGNLSVRRLDSQVIEKLRIQAANHGVSMEEEVRHILTRAVAAPHKITDVFLKHFGAKNGIELKISPKQPHEPIDFDEDFDR